MYFVLLCDQTLKLVFLQVVHSAVLYVTLVLPLCCGVHHPPGPEAKLLVDHRLKNKSKNAMKTLERNKNRKGFRLWRYRSDNQAWEL